MFSIIIKKAGCFNLFFIQVASLSK